MKVLLYNLAYCTGVDGSVPKYISRNFNHVLPWARKKTGIVDRVEEMLDREQPDVCCFAEIDCDSPLIARMQRHYPYSNVSHKYAKDGWHQHCPVIRKKGNAVFSKRPCTMEKHYFPSGTKRLLYEVSVENGPSVFASHFSLGHRTRTKQIEFLSDIVHSRKKPTVVCGDFNIFRGISELRALIEKTGLVLANNPEHGTFPSHRPKKLLDLFLHSPDLPVASMRVLNDVRLSDHLPIVLELAIQR